MDDLDESYLLCRRQAKLVKGHLLDGTHKLLLGKSEVGSTEFTLVSRPYLEPVSKMTLKSCGGVPS